MRSLWKYARLAVVTAPLLGALAALGMGPAPRPARNLVILCVDTLRADHVGAYGYPLDTSPQIDAIADRGRLFRHAGAQSNWTVPATASLLTSLYPSDHGAGVQGKRRHLSRGPEGKLRQMRPSVRTLGKILRGSGFRTGLFSANPFLFGLFKRGFDTTYVRRVRGDELTDRALTFIESARHNRFFLYMQFMDLHEPIEPPEPFFSLFEADGFGPRKPGDGKWDHMRETDFQNPAFLRYRAHHIALYDGALRYVDSQIDRLLTRLRQMGLEHDTLVVVTSDHGEEFWDHAELERTLAEDPRGFWGIGHGHTMFQELLHIPLVFRGPGVPAGPALDCPVSQIDVAPTALELLGLEPEAGMRGQSLVPLLAGSGAEVCDERVQIAESPAYGPDSTSVSWKREKLILRHDEKPFLYDLRRDPGERDDLSARWPQAVAGLRQMLHAEKPDGGMTPPSGEVLPLDDAKAAELRALGYLD